MPRLVVHPVIEAKWQLYNTAYREWTEDGCSTKESRCEAHVRAAMLRWQV